MMDSLGDFSDDRRRRLGVCRWLGKACVAAQVKVHGAQHPSIIMVLLLAKDTRFHESAMQGTEDIGFFGRRLLATLIALVSGQHFQGYL